MSQTTKAIGTPTASRRGMLLGPVVCRVTGRPRPHVWTMRAAAALRICLRCSRTVCP